MAELRRLNDRQRLEAVRQLAPEDQQALAVAIQYEWSLWRRPLRRREDGFWGGQEEPPGDWRFWVVLAGRGYGKTRTGAEWIREKAESGLHRWMTIVGPTREAVYKILLKGPAGLLNISPPWYRPKHVPSRTLLLYPNGACVRYYSAERPERLRGEQHEIVWMDELGAWPRQEAFEQIDMGLRLGPKPQALITTTPRQLPLITDLVLGPKMRDGRRVARADVVVTKGRSEENAANLSNGAIEAMRARYGDSRLGRQELDAELLERVESALWSEELLNKYRVRGVPTMKRVVVAVDPTRADSPTDECGIIVAGLGEDGAGYVLEDLSLRASPHGWLTQAVAGYHKYRADAMVYETNRLGKVAENTMRATDQSIKWVPVTATVGKTTRADPVSALYEQGKVHHVGELLRLEDEMVNWDPTGRVSPNRMDALVWALTELMLGLQKPPLIVR